MTAKTKSERLQVVNEIKMNCIEQNYGNNVAIKVLYAMLENYYQHGTKYIDKKLTLLLHDRIPRYILVNLYNDIDKVDKVIIKQN